MKNSSFVILFGLVALAYIFGDFNTFYGYFPEGGSTITSLIKGLLAAIATFILIKKLKDFVKINPELGLIIVGVVGAAGYLYEAGKEQRVGRKMLARHLTTEAASGASITYNEGSKWLDSSVLIGFKKSDMDPKKNFPNYRKIPFCNIVFPGSEKLLNQMTPEQKDTGNFYWSHKNDPSGTGIYYTLVAQLPENENWFYQTSLVEEKAPNPEHIEKGRVPVENGGYVDRECGKAPFRYHKKAYNAQNIINAEWDEKDGTEKYNEMVFDRYGRELNGQVEAEFVYFVEKSEEFQKGFGKGGMMRCVGYYTYKGGKKHGPFEFYYPGRIARAFTGQYENGVQVGVHRQYNPNGSLKRSWNTSPASNDTNAETETTTLSR